MSSEMSLRNRRHGLPFSRRELIPSRMWLVVLPSTQYFVGTQWGPRSVRDDMDVSKGWKLQIRDGVGLLSATVSLEARNKHDHVHNALQTLSSTIVTI